MIELRGDTLTETLEHYFAHSGQLPTRIWLATDEQTTAGLLLQQLPGNDAEPDAWRRLNVLADTPAIHRTAATGCFHPAATVVS